MLFEAVAVCRTAFTRNFYCRAIYLRQPFVQRFGRNLALALLSPNRGYCFQFVCLSVRLSVRMNTKWLKFA